MGTTQTASAPTVTAHFRTNRPTLPAHGTITIRNTGRRIQTLDGLYTIVTLR